VVAPHVARVVVVGTNQFRVISQSVKKTDPNDARLLSLYLSKGLLPEVRMKNPLKDVAWLILETGLRLGEALILTWDDVALEPSAGKKFGWLQVQAGKTARLSAPLA
jgi:integrase